MKKTKTRKRSQSTKYAFVFSVVSMLFSIAMFVGVTYAWFTDTVTSGVTTILASKWMDVELLDENNQNIVGETLKWIDTDNNTEVNSWTPGKTYKLQSFKINNDGNIDLKYRIMITGISNLGDSIEWSYIVGNSTVKDLSEEGHLKAGATSELITVNANFKAQSGSDTQSMSIDGIGITVYATQDTNGATYSYEEENS